MAFSPKPPFIPAPGLEVYYISWVIEFVFTWIRHSVKLKQLYVCQ